MPKDAKFGLFAGVLGVIVVAVVSMQRPSPTPSANPAPKEQAAATPTGMLDPKPNARPKDTDSPRAPEALPGDLASTPVVRGKKEPDATPTSRPRNNDDIDP